MRCHLNKSKTCKISHTKNKTCCKNAKLGQDWCWSKSKKINVLLLNRK